jgi:D-3-phosphoglycerate dehydrogenase
MKICCITSNPQIEFIKEDLEKLGEFAVFNKQKLTPDEVTEIASGADILIAGSSGIQRISSDLIDKLPNLKLITLLTVGFDWVDVAYARSKGISVCNIKGANSESVAEQTWAMILDLAKRVTEFSKDAQNKGAFKFGDYKGKEIYGKTLGVIGLGDIGKKVARGAKGFDMEVIGVNKSGSQVDGVKLVSLDELLSNSDVITICTPLNEETRNLITSTEINKMKNGVILVNCAREEIVNKKDIVQAVTTGKVFGYGIETAIMTPIPTDDEYLKSPRVIAIPHNAFNTEDADKKSYEMVLKNIESFLNNNPQNVIN